MAVLTLRVIDNKQQDLERKTTAAALSDYVRKEKYNSGRKYQRRTWVIARARKSIGHPMPGNFSSSQNAPYF